MSERYTLHLGDNLEALRAMADDSIDAIVTDPPYGLSFMGKKWDYDVPSVDTWRECLRVLKPGGHLLAFAGTRTQHRMAVNIEDAGFEIRDMIAWVYGSGFPKSRDISKDIDRMAGKKRKIVGQIAAPGIAKTNVEQGAQARSIYTFDKLGGPITDAAKQWAGWGTALKPAMEPITVARKPLRGTVASNVLEYGTGGLNIDGCRIPTDDNLNGGGYDPNGQSQKNLQNASSYATKPIAKKFLQPTGRWPANLIHDGSEEVMKLFPTTSPARKNNTSDGRSVAFFQAGGEKSGGYSGRHDPSNSYEDDGGSAARFFYCAKASNADRNEGLEGFGSKQQDPGRKDGNPGGDNPRNRGLRKRQNHHPTVKPTNLMRYLCRLVTPPGGLILDPYMGSGSTGKAAMLEGFRFVGCEMEPEYMEIARARIAHAASQVVQEELL